MQDDLDYVCTSLKEFQVRRRFVIASEVENVNRVTALCARMCGYVATDKESRKANWKHAERIVKRALDGKDQDSADLEIAAAIHPELVMMRQSLEPILTRREEIETKMSKLAALLPVQKFVKETKGFKHIGLAVIVGEAGNLSNYAKIRRLWRRLGYGMAKGHEKKAYSTWRMYGGLSAEEWTRAGYSPPRLGQIYGVVTVPLMMHKKKNKYGAVYEARRARTLITHPEWYVDENGKAKLNEEGKPSSKHAQMDAQRIATKEFLYDLWLEWRRSGEIMESTRSMAGAAPVPDAVHG